MDSIVYIFGCINLMKKHNLTLYIIDGEIYIYQNTGLTEEEIWHNSYMKERTIKNLDNYTKVICDSIVNEGASSKYNDLFWDLNRLFSFSNINAIIDNRKSIGLCILFKFDDQELMLPINKNNKYQIRYQEINKYLKHVLDHCIKNKSSCHINV